MCGGVIWGKSPKRDGVEQRSSAERNSVWGGEGLKRPNDDQRMCRGVELYDWI